jgi:hypothetical protein
MTGAELRQDSANRRGVTLNSILGIGAESVNAAVEILLLPSLILAFFVAELTPSYILIGLVPALAASLWTLGRGPAHLLTATRHRRQPWVFAAAVIRAAAIVILAIVALRTDPISLARAGRPLLGTFFLCLIVFAFAGGFGSVPAAALMRRSIGGESWEAFARWRAAWTAGLCLLAALVISRLLGSNALGFPNNYGRLFLVATICLIAVAVFFAAMRETPVAGGAHSMPALSPRAWRQPLRDARYRRFLLFRILLTATAAIDPFLILYAVTRLGAPTTAIGGYAIAGVLGWLVSAPFWAVGERRSGPRAILQGAAVVRLIAPAIALVLPQIAATGAISERLPSGAITNLFGIAFFTIGAALAGQARANHDYLTPLAPSHLLSLYSALTNAVLVLVAFAPVVGGALIQRSGYEALFGVVLALGLVAVFAGGWLADIPASSRQRLDQPSATRRALPASPG